MLIGLIAAIFGSRFGERDEKDLSAFVRLRFSERPAVKSGQEKRPARTSPPWRPSTPDYAPQRSSVAATGGLTRSVSPPTRLRYVRDQRARGLGRLSDRLLTVPARVALPFDVYLGLA